MNQNKIYESDEVEVIGESSRGLNGEIKTNKEEKFLDETEDAVDDYLVVP